MFRPRLAVHCHPLDHALVWNKQSLAVNNLLTEESVNGHCCVAVARFCATSMDVVVGAALWPVATHVLLVSGCERSKSALVVGSTLRHYVKS
jgi:hypothetical protein